MRDDDDLYEQIDKALESAASGRSRWPGMTYEQGVETALRWAMGEIDEKPIEDD